MKKIGVYGLVCLILIGCGGEGAPGVTENIDDSNNVTISLTEEEQRFLNAINAERVKDQKCGTVTMPKTRALKWNRKLALAAEDHAKDISENNYRREDKNDPTVLMTDFDTGEIREVTSVNRHEREHETFHVGSGTSMDVALKTFPQYTESTFVERIQYRGYQISKTAGENITVGTSKDVAEKAVEAWLASPSHCRNLMSPDFKEVGMSHIIKDDAFYKNYWVQEFGG